MTDDMNYVVPHVVSGLGTDVLLCPMHFDDLIDQWNGLTEPFTRSYALPQPQIERAHNFF
jgi:hypothetical protein